MKRIKLSRLQAVGYRKKISALALSACVVSGGAFAQSSVGEIRGTVAGSEGDAIRIENPSTGYSREVKIDKGGRYDVTAVATGEYKVSLLRGAEVVSVQDVQVAPGIATTADFNAAGARATQLQAVTVKGSGINAIDVSKAETSTVFTARELQQIPVARDEVSVALLTPGASAGSAAFNGANGNLPSFGGSTVAENSYYINGFDVTNLFDNLSFSPPPFEAIGAEQVLTGGYGPEYNRSTGGVISIVTKRGSNQFDAGASYYWEPNSLRGREPAVYYGTTTSSQGDPAGAQKTPLLYQSFYKEYVDKTEANFWASGPIIKDRLFYYFLVQKAWTGNDTDGVGKDTAPGASTQTAFTGNHTREPFYLGKIDAEINSRNHLEFTYLNDNQRENSRSFNESYQGPPGDKTIVGDYTGNLQTVTGGNLYTAKFTSNITDALTFDAQWGQLTYKQDSVSISPTGTEQTYNGVLGDTNQPGCPFVTDNTTNGADSSQPGVFISSNCSTGNGLTTAGTVNTRTNYRSEVEYKFNFGKLGAFNYGAHDVSFGYEHDNFNSAGTGYSLEGGTSYTYNTRATADQGDTTPYAGQTYVEQAHYQTSASARVTEQSFYLKDDWQILDRVVLNLGLRDDGFNNRNASGNAGQTYVKQYNIYQPRLGAVWDVKGDSSMKVFASYGLYSLPITASVAVRGASAAINEVTTYYYTGVDPGTGIPTGLTPTPTSASDPLGIYHGEGYYINGATGIPPNPNSIADNKLKPIEQSEYRLGLQARLYDDWTGSVTGIHRNLDQTIDDSCDGRPLQAAAESQYGITIGNGSSDGSGSLPNGVAGCYIINPGRGAVLQEPIDVNNPSKFYTLNLSAADIGEPKAKRVYDALIFTVDKSWAHRWFFNGSYVWSHSYGNTEGLVKSSIGQGDTGTTEDFDFPELMQNAYGSQANDHRHTLKTFGAYKPIPDFTVGANFLLQTGSPYSCLGTNSGNDPYGYGSGYHFCGGKPAPQGTAGYTDLITQVDLNFLYTPHQIKGLEFSLNVNNIFDEHGVESVYQRGESSSGAPYLGQASGSDNKFGTPYAFGLSPYQTPRYFRFGARYDFKL